MFELDETELRHAIDQIILSGSAITGSSLPQTEFIATFLFSEISKFLIEMGYGELTLDEVLLAMRLNSSGMLTNSSSELVSVELRTQNFNVMFVASVLVNYVQMRHLLDRKLQNQIDGYEVR